MVYLDAASAEPLHPAARQVWAAAVDQGWADPARLHPEAARSRLLLDTARASVAAALGAHPDEVAFTSSGTQALHLAVLGGLAGSPAVAGTPPRLVLGAVEHSAALHAGRLHARAAGDDALVETVPVDRAGRVDVDAFAAAVRRPGVGLAVLQSGNHEVGTLQPVAAVVEACAAAEVPLLVDAAQSAGRLALPRGWSMLTASAHKWGGPPGVGVLVVRRGVRYRSPLPEDEREGGRVPGPPNVPAVLAAATALEAASAEAGEESPRLSRLVQRIREEVPRRVSDVEVVGHPTERLPHIVTFSCLYVDGEALVSALARAGHSVGSGSSCTASTLRPSHVLEAMGVLTHGNVRVSLPRGVGEDDVERFLDDLEDAVRVVRAQAGVETL